MSEPMLWFDPCENQREHTSDSAEDRRRTCSQSSFSKSAQLLSGIEAGSNLPSSWMMTRLPFSPTISRVDPLRLR